MYYLYFAAVSITFFREILRNSGTHGKYFEELNYQFLMSYTIFSLEKGLFTFFFIYEICVKNRSNFSIALFSRIGIGDKWYMTFKHDHFIYEIRMVKC